MCSSAPTRWLGNDGFYLLFLSLAVAVVAVSIVVSSSRAGYALRAIHQDEDAAAAMGVNTTRAKTLAFAGSAALTGAIGAAYAFQQVTIFPERPFDVNQEVAVVEAESVAGAVAGEDGGEAPGGTLRQLGRRKRRHLHAGQEEGVEVRDGREARVRAQRRVGRGVDAHRIVVDEGAGHRSVEQVVIRARRREDRPGVSVGIEEGGAPAPPAGSADEDLRLDLPDDRPQRCR